MAYCKNCGAEIGQAYACPKCGAPQGGYPQQPVNDNGGFLWSLLGCCIPIVGLILYLVWRDTKPVTGKAAGMGALVGFIIGIVSYVLMIVLGLGAAMLS